MAICMAVRLSKHNLVPVAIPYRLAASGVMAVYEVKFVLMVYRAFHRIHYKLAKNIGHYFICLVAFGAVLVPEVFVVLAAATGKCSGGRCSLACTNGYIFYPHTVKAIPVSRYAVPDGVYTIYSNIISAGYQVVNQYS